MPLCTNAAPGSPARVCVHLQHRWSGITCLAAAICKGQMPASARMLAPACLPTYLPACTSASSCWPCCLPDAWPASPLSLYLPACHPATLPPCLPNLTGRRRCRSSFRTSGSLTASWAGCHPQPACALVVLTGPSPGWSRSPAPCCRRSAGPGSECAAAVDVATEDGISRVKEAD